MVSPQILSPREKVLSLIAGTLIVVFALVGYGEAYSGSTSVLVAQDDSQNQQNYLRDQGNNLKNWKSEVNGYKKNVKAPATVDTGAFDAAAAKYDSCIQALREFVGKPDFWNMTQDCNSLNRDVSEAINPIRDVSNCYQTRRSIEDRKREKKNNIDSQIKNILRNNKNADLTEVNKIVDALNAQFAAYDALGAACDAGVNDKLNDIQNELNPLFQDFYTVSNDVNRAADEARRKIEGEKDFNSNIKKQCEKEMSRRMKEIDKQFTKAQKTLSADIIAKAQESYGKLKGLYDGLCGATGLITQMQTALTNSDTAGFESARQDYWDNQREYNDNANDVQNQINEALQRAESLKHATRDLQQKTRELARVKKDIERLKKSYSRLSKKYVDRSDVKEALAAFASTTDQLSELVKKIEAGLAAAKDEAERDPDSYWVDHGEELNDLFNEYNEVTQRLQMIGNVLQTLQQASKELAGYQQQLAFKKKLASSSIQKELAAALEDIVNRAVDTLKDAWSKAVTDPEEAMNTIQALQDLRNEWNDALNPDGDNSSPYTSCGPDGCPRPFPVSGGSEPPATTLPTIK